MARQGAAILVFLLFSHLSNADGWRTYRHDCSLSGVTADAVEPSLSLQWTFQPAHPPKPAWPLPAEELPRVHADSVCHVTVSDGTAYFATSADNRVYAVRASTGKIRWTFFAEGPVRFAPTLWNDRVFFGSDDGHVYCLRAQNGELLWKHRAGSSDEKVLGNGRMISLWPVRTSVLVEDGVVYFGAGVFPYEGIYICALHAGDGSVVWKNDTMGDRSQEMRYGGITPQSYLAASPNVLYVPSGRAMPAAFDRKTGKFLYYCSPGGKIGGTWVLVDGRRLIAGTEKFSTPAKVIYEERTGRRTGDAYAWFPARDMVLTSDVSYLLTETGIHAIDRSLYPEINRKLTAARKERQELRDRILELKAKLPYAEKESAKGADSTLWSRIPICEEIDAATSRIAELARQERTLKVSACKWEYPAQDLSTLILAGDTIFAGGAGFLVALDAETGKELRRIETEGRVQGLAAAEGYLFASDEHGEILCFGERRVRRPKTIRASSDPSPYRNDRFMAACEAAAEAIVESSGVTKGYCLVLGCGTGRLAFQLARRTDLKIVGLEKDPGKIKTARERLAAAGLYGSRVVVEPWDLSTLPDYFANLIVSEEAMASGRLDWPANEMYRVLRPCGGLAYFGQPLAIAAPGRSLNERNLLAWLARSGAPDPQVSRENGLWARVERGKLEGAGDWTHLYNNPGNTASSEDSLVRWPLGVLWFGEPGPDAVVERHARAPSSVSINGRLIVQGEEAIRAYDAYNGTFLWKRALPGAVRARSDVDGGNLALTADSLYVAAGDKCQRLDVETGEVEQTYRMPTFPDDIHRRWGYIAHANKTLFGSSALPLTAEYGEFQKTHVRDGAWVGPDEVRPDYQTTYEYFTTRYPVPDGKLREALHRGGTNWRSMTKFPPWGSQKDFGRAQLERMLASDSVFAIDPETDELRWTHRGKKIAHITCTIGDGTFFFTECAVSADETDGALETMRAAIEDGRYEEGAEAGPGRNERDIRRVIALDASTGEKLWEKPLDLTGCGGEKMGAAYSDGILLFFGHFSNHDRGFFRDSELTWRRITALSAKTGDILWSKSLNYLRRPVIVGDEIIIEPRACDIRTGQIRMRRHPITGRKEPWEFLRPGHSCGVISAARNAMFYRSDTTAIVDLKGDAGLAIFGGVRGGCWLDFIPANGLLLFPESSSGCTCSYPIRTTVAFKGKAGRRRQPWTVFIAQGPITPAKRLAVNFGAPGDRTDANGKVWFGYPRPKTNYGVKFDLRDEVRRDAGYFCEDYRGFDVENTDRPWLCASGCVGLTRCELPLIDDCWGEQPGVYTIRLGFVAPPGDRPGRRMFDVKLQGKTVLKDFDVVAEAGAPKRLIVKEFRGVEVNNSLLLELVPGAEDSEAAELPFINFAEAVCESPRQERPPIRLAWKVEEIEVMSVLKAADTLLEGGNSRKALPFYHTVLDVATATESLCAALERLAEIGSPESLGLVSQFCREDAAILRDYEPTRDSVREGAARTYTAIARNVAEADEMKALRMLERSLAMPGPRKFRRQTLVDYVGVAERVAEEDRPTAIRALKRVLRYAKDHRDVQELVRYHLEQLAVESENGAAE